MLNADWLCCPICAEPLTRAGNALHCPDGHAFDIAREGYVNLLAGGRGPRRSEGGGDTREMLAARRRFLERGHYDPLADALAATAGEHLRALPPRAAHERARLALDLGCGEGFYLGRARDALRSYEETGAIRCGGIDLSKEAVRMAAKRHPACAFAVADINRRLPVADAACDLLLNVFAPRNPAEFRRVIAPDGLLLVAIPGPDHLAELRDAFGLLAIEEEKERRMAERFAGRFAPLPPQTIAYDLDLSGEALRDLVLMTPNSWHLTPALETALDTTPGLRTRASFIILPFRPLAPGHPTAAPGGSI